MDYNTEEVESLKEWLSEMADSTEYEHAEFEVADGVTVAFDWSMEYDEATLPISVLIHGEGFDLFTRSAERTLVETGALGHGENHGDELAAGIETWVYHNFSKNFDELVFEYGETNADLWQFTAWVLNPNFER